MKKRPSLITDAKGQAIFELILFVPFILSLYFYVFSLGSSINGSINQQKAARGYFYARIKNNSFMPKSRFNAPSALYQSVQNSVSFDFIGWMVKMQGEKSPIAACYELKGPFLVSTETDCNSYTDTKTKYVRVQTVYGVCGATLIKDPTLGLIPVYHTLYAGVDGDQNPITKCVNQ